MIKIIIITVSIYLIYFFIKRKFFKLESIDKKEGVTSMIECDYCNVYIK